MPRKRPIGTSTVSCCSVVSPISCDARGREAALRRPAEHPRELVGQQHHQQHARDRDEGPSHFAQQVTIKPGQQSSRAPQETVGNSRSV